MNRSRHAGDAFPRSRTKGGRKRTLPFILILPIVMVAGSSQDDAAALIRKLGDPSVDVRDQAEKELVGMKSAALPELHKARNHDDLEVRARVQMIISAIEKGILRDALKEKIPLDVQRQRPELIDAILSDDAARRLGVLKAMTGVQFMGPLKVAPGSEFDVTWEHEEAYYPYYGGGGVYEIKLPEPAMRAIFEILVNDKEAKVRSVALVGVKNFKVVLPAEKIAALLKDDSFQVRMRAIDLVPSLMADEGLPHLRAMLADRTGMVAAYAAHMLHARLDRGSIPAFRECLGNPRQKRNLPTALVSLGELGDTESEKAIVAFLEDKEAKVVAAACRALVLLDAKDRASDLVKALSHPHPTAQTHAAFALALLGQRDHLDAIRKAQGQITEKVGAWEVNHGRGSEFQRPVWETRTYEGAFVVIRALLGDHGVGATLADVVTWGRQGLESPMTDELVYGLPELRHLDLLLAAQALLEPERSRKLWAEEIETGSVGTIRELGQAVRKAMGDTTERSDRFVRPAIWPEAKVILPAKLSVLRAFRIYANHFSHTSFSHTSLDRGGRLFGEPLRIVETVGNDLWIVLGHMLSMKYPVKR